MSAPIGGVAWAKHHDTWERVHLCADRDGARLMAFAIENPGHPDDDPQDAKVFEVEAIGTLCTLTPAEFAALHPAVSGVRATPNRAGRRCRAASCFDLRGRQAHVHRRIGHEFVEVYLDDTVSYETVGCATWTREVTL